MPTILNYADFTNKEDIYSLCQSTQVICDFKLYDIPATMRRNVKTCAELGVSAVTVSNHKGNSEGIIEAQKAGKEYGIKIIVGNVR